MLAFVRFFTPGHIRVIQLLLRLYWRRRLIIMVVSNSWLAWKTYRQIQHELTKEINFEVNEAQFPT